MIYREDYEEHEHEGCCSWDEERIKKIEEETVKLENLLRKNFLYLCRKIKKLEEKIEGD